MNIGIAKEDPRKERRVALTPAAVQSLVSAGHNVYIQAEAGNASHFRDNEYEQVGAKVVFSPDEVFGRSEMLLKISSPTDDECASMMDSQILFSFLHLPVAKRSTLDLFLQKRICSIGYELIEDRSGNLPVLQVMSEIAGQMSTQIACRLLQSNHGGRGIVLGGIAGVPPATVVIIGAGNVGQSATRMALGAGAEVVVLDNDLSRLRALENRFNYRVVTAMATEYNIRRALQFADVVIGAVLIKAERAPHVVTEDMVKQMKPGSIVIDVSIDQGGCVETSRPTTIESPTFVVHDVIHYCVPNIPACVARTATYGLTNALLPYVLEIAERGITLALREIPGLAQGVCTYNGACTKESIARRFGLEWVDIRSFERMEQVL